MNDAIKITEYESKELVSINKWENDPPNIVNKALGVVSAPVSWMVRKVVPEKAIVGALNFASCAGNFLADTRDLKRDGKVNEIAELRKVDLSICDSIANGVHNWALAFAAVEGGGTGWFGLPGMAVDIPALITFSLRTIHKIGLCYGFESKSEDDEKFILNVLSAAGANNPSEKNVAILAMREIEVMLLNQSWRKIGKIAAEKAVGKETAVIAIRNLAKQLGINITKRKALQAIPFVGAGIGAAMNAQYINDICWAARRSFQKRWLGEKGAIEV